MIEDYLRLAALLFTVLNPFMVSIYLLDLIRDLSPGAFASVLVRAAMISLAVFLVFAVGGESIFSTLLNVHFGSFQIFGGLIFVVIGARFVFSGVESLQGLRGRPQHLAGSIAMPFMIGPGTVSASVIIGSQAGGFPAAAAIIAATIAFSCSIVVALKFMHDHVRRQNSALIERYTEIVGRVSGLIIGTIAVEMIYRGVRSFIDGPVGA